MNKKVTIYTDGACSGNPGPGGWGAIIIYKDQEKEISGHQQNTTNNQMEITAAIKALESLNVKCDVSIYTDSVYVKNGITSWIHAWLKNNWLTSAKKPVKNIELWQKLWDLTKKHNISWYWVKGHSTNEGNIRADKLACDAKLLAY